MPFVWKKEITCGLSEQTHGRSSTTLFCRESSIKVGKWKTNAASCRAAVQAGCVPVCGLSALVARLQSGLNLSIHSFPVLAWLYSGPNFSMGNGFNSFPVRTLGHAAASYWDQPDQNESGPAGLRLEPTRENRERTRNSMGHSRARRSRTRRNSMASESNQRSVTPKTSPRVIGPNCAGEMYVGGGPWGRKQMNSIMILFRSSWIGNDGPRSRSGTIVQGQFINTVAHCVDWYHPLFSDRRLRS